MIRSRDLSGRSRAREQANPTQAERDPCRRWPSDLTWTKDEARLPVAPDLALPRRPIRSMIATVTLPERIANLAQELPPEKQAEVLDFVEFLRTRRASSGAPMRGSLEALHGALDDASGAADDGPDWSPFDVEPADFGDSVLDS